MKKIYNLLKPEYNLRVINLFMDRPKEWILKEEVENSLREYTSYSGTGGSLKALTSGRLLIEKTDKSRRKSYRISSRSDAYGNFFSGYFLSDPENIGKFLNSNYTIYMIEKRGFEKVYDMIRTRLTDSRFRSIAFTSLLDISSTKEDYQRFAVDLKSTISEVRNRRAIERKTKKRFLLDDFNDIHQELSPSKIKHIEMLKDFEPRKAVRFYRENIHGSVVAGLDTLRDKNVVTEGLHEFLVFDNYISPLTSYPVNGTLQLLFAQPFQRIYEDIYLLDGEATDMMSSRAAVIYNNFADLILELIKNDPPERKYLLTMTKEMIFYWNVSSTRFDLICDQFARIYEEAGNCGNYHLEIKGLIYKIANLDDNSKQLLPENAGRSILIEGSTPLIFEEYDLNYFLIKPMEDPFTSIRPCLTFKDMKLRNDFIPIEEIMNKLELKLSEFKKEN